MFSKEQPRNNARHTWRPAVDNVADCDVERFPHNSKLVPTLVHVIITDEVHDVGWRVKDQRHWTART